MYPCFLLFRLLLCMHCVRKNRSTVRQINKVSILMIRTMHRDRSYRNESCLPSTTSFQ
ncbi:hypothetical protein PF005_g7835 [Phytophthora fragariae]|uniref:RxLR effector protein n=1 Tax=Phytophthora fragariae TaxID=53985 RepID=A0A6A3LMP4_9STRA|nr:hypothetical protein PF003_g7376 [Phytophthora fragariae]KAE8941618.1 hypothetical protein PF009_g8595 [Phytophthora fragariae]KAE9017063.1 hypothetical protein PF011_g6865 [Phytophthora fragariae]KAE9115609.1 hypothetical protein PF010_g9261 [Phytophthora fragariae]KAE9119741.1 hypothetical protein PF007_g8437 [Phytophthora fragariae]